MIFDHLKMFKLKKEIKNNPYIGDKDIDGIYVYTKGRYTIRYKVLNNLGKGPRARIVSIRHKMTALEREKRNIKHLLKKIFYYQSWVNLFKSHIIISFALGTAILYFGVIEPYKVKVDRFRWIVAKVIGVDKDQVEYRGGLVRIFAKRHPAYKEDAEQVYFTFNPLQIFSSKFTGNVTRWSKEAGYVTHQISYDSSDNIWMKLKGDWIHGVVLNNQVKWDEPKEATRGGITGHKITGKNKGLLIIDQK